jgi:hypothetical protein
MRQLSDAGAPTSAEESLGCEPGVAARLHAQMRSNTAAMPCPPPMHIVTSA